MRKLTEVELMVLSTVVRAEIADMEAENQSRVNGGYALAYSDYSSDNYTLLAEQLEIIKKEIDG